MTAVLMDDAVLSGFPSVEELKTALIWFIVIGLMTLIGLCALICSLTSFFSHKPNYREALIFAAITTFLLSPAAVFGVICLTLPDVIVIGIISSALSVLLIVYDVFVIKKNIIQKKNKSTEEQKNG
ncbi:MAG: hypothetical protein II820_11315 [Ruminiclostridium sp.]|nr:hypothetical protein [Ruminiclostridium sp.]